MIHKNLILDNQPTGKASEYFSYEEFTQSNYGKPVFNRLSKHLLECLSRNILDPIRKEFGHPILVTSGMRDTNVMNGLRDAGYFPSATTDHSFGDPEFNVFGSGASDIRPLGSGTCEDIFTVVIKLIQTVPGFQVGQVLWERQGDREWVHISNPKSVLFQPEISIMIASKLMIGYGLDGKYYSDKPWS